MAPTAKTVKDIFKDFSARRNAIICALTSEVDDFYRLCDPDKKSLGLYGHPNGKWEVTASPENVPTVLPYPVLGINFARDGMNRTDWLSLIAIHSDSWLISVAFVFAGRLKRSQRQKLYSMINDLPTVYEVLTERNSIEDKPSMDSASGSKSQGSTKRSIDEQAENNPKLVDDSLKYAEDEHTESLCGSCGGKDNVDEFWIACDVCQRWFHGMCVKMTPSKAESIEEYECPSCSMKKTHCGSCGGKYSVDEFCMGCDVCKR